MPLCKHHYLSSTTQRGRQKPDNLKQRRARGLVLRDPVNQRNELHSSISSGACDQPTGDVHATRQPASTLRLDCLPLDRSGLGRNVDADPNDILGSIH